MSKANKKTSTKNINNSRIILEIESDIKSQLITIAKDEGKTLATYLRVLIKSYLKKYKK